ncbi:HTH domain-containing protein [Enterococcus sp. DIV0806c]|uniref:HTH domain-containing protein n=1 Tax=unclassified Enterococcus TaxID=2608891 RepID=UPI003F28F2CE
MLEFQMAFITSAEVKRWMQVLSMMEQEQRFTIGELSEQLAISQRTLIKDIQTFKNHFGTSIELRANYSGYRFEERNRRDYQEKKNNCWEFIFIRR